MQVPTFKNLFDVLVAAFHLKWDESILEKNIGNWSVNIIQLSRSKRHLDKASLMNFWEILDKWDTLIFLTKLKQVLIKLPLSQLYTSFIFAIAKLFHKLANFLRYKT